MASRVLLLCVDLAQSSVVAVKMLKVQKKVRYF